MPWTSSKGHKLHDSCLNITENIFSMGMIRKRYRLFREVAMPWFLEIFRNQTGMALSKLLYWPCSEQAAWTRRSPEVPSSFRFSWSLPILSAYAAYHRPAVFHFFTLTFTITVATQCTMVVLCSTVQRWVILFRVTFIKWFITVVKTHQTQLSSIKLWYF